MGTQAHLAHLPIIEVIDHSKTHTTIVKDGIKRATIAYIISIGQWSVDIVNTPCTLHTTRLDAITSTLEVL